MSSRSPFPLWGAGLAVGGHCTLAGRLAACGFTSLMVACASSGVRYSGVYAEPARAPGDVELSSVVRADATELGELQGSCSEPRAPLAGDELEDGVLYGDLVCSRELLVSTMRDTAAYVGGTHLVRVICDRDERTWECSGLVMRVTNEHAERVTEGRAGDAVAAQPTSDAGLRGKGAAPDSTEEPARRSAVRDPWAVEVSVKPSDAGRVAPRVGSAHLVPRMPASDHLLGEVAAECDGQCDEELLRDAVSAGARYAGAEHLGYASCEQVSDDAVCQSWASSYQVHFVPVPASDD